MSLYTISDLHLSLSADKPMDVFYGWDNYIDRINANWKRTVSENDTVIIPGDISWALKLEDSQKDFEFLDSLPGKKIILKGNHDLWWSTMKKLTSFFESKGIKTVTPLFNSAVAAEGRAICGSRGWFFEKDDQNKKILLREAGRLDMSITEAEKIGEPLVFLHYPPVYAEIVCDEIIDALKKHNIKTVYHGHIHGSGLHRAVTEYDGIRFKLVSCDCIDFTPQRILL